MAEESRDEESQLEKVVIRILEKATVREGGSKLCTNHTVSPFGDDE